MKTMKNDNDKFYVRDAERFLGIYREKLFYWEATGKIPQAKREPMSNYRFWTAFELEKISQIINKSCQEY